MGYDVRLGPGSYVSGTPTPRPSFRFSPTPRFESIDDNKRDMIYPKVIYLDETRRHQINKRIQKNKRLVIMSPTEIQQSLLCKFKHKHDIELHNRRAKQILDAKKQQDKFLKISAKHTKFESNKLKSDNRIVCQS